MKSHGPIRETPPEARKSIPRERALYTIALITGDISGSRACGKRQTGGNRYRADDDKQEPDDI